MNTSANPIIAPGYAGAAPAVSAQDAASVRTRIVAIDVMRGLVMLFMLVDNVRETIYLHLQVSDRTRAIVRSGVARAGLSNAAG